MTITPRQMIIETCATRLANNLPADLTDKHIWDMVCKMVKTRKQAEYYSYVVLSLKARKRLINDIRSRTTTKIMYPSPLDSIFEGLMDTLDDLVSQLGRPIK